MTKTKTMTRTPRPTGWIAAAIAVPAAAAVFAGSVAWADAHDPLEEQRRVQAAVDARTASQFPSNATQAAEKHVVELQTRLDELTAKIVAVNAQTRKVKGSTPVVVYRPQSGGSGGGATSSSPPASSGGTGGSQ
jgi:hypothetical protein